MNPPPRVILASQSPRRLALLRSIGIEPLIQPAFFDERILDGEDAWELVRRLAHGKATSVLARGLGDSPALLVGADTVVVLDGAILGKPGSPEAAISMLERLSGKEHLVLTGLALIRIPDGELDLSVAQTIVRFRDLDQSEICAYVQREDVSDVAGAYRIQDLGALLVQEIRGTWSNVVGLPLELLYQRASSLGFLFL